MFIVEMLIVYYNAVRLIQIAPGLGETCSYHVPHFTRWLQAVVMVRKVNSDHGTLEYFNYTRVKLVARHCC